MSVYGDGLSDVLIKYELVGSRITCNPPPTNTDQDILVLVKAIPFYQLEQDGWIMGAGSNITYRNHDGDFKFLSFRKGDLNYIITTSDRFFDDFMTCTRLAKKFNLLLKEDRVLLFDTFMEKEIVNQ